MSTNESRPQGAALDATPIVNATADNGNRPRGWSVLDVLAFVNAFAMTTAAIAALLLLLAVLAPADWLRVIAQGGGGA